MAFQMCDVSLLDEIIVLLKDKNKVLSLQFIK